jgi:hypothetical protein
MTALRIGFDIAEVLSKNATPASPKSSTAGLVMPNDPAERPVPKSYMLILGSAAAVTYPGQLALRLNLGTKCSPTHQDAVT